ncbi:hypothetical protein [Acidipropionibacterium jensenii]|uniref:hypothetical protein n=1 Tax=Acidipropionibacterium jensenii TaxID=1749 RepID=UPI002648A08C|nr:hypothetical protein [Acidipropionibacterium jensenii]MDN5995897.1 hypothetical protein [Acidipropionibacterium jensenii]MDN6427995.1 hypothetical protein [Acidipropionibacterium jensenii]MDN6513341.1 hypothetical protein [Acidipropionibacterium jensenii]MDN6793033.1 hypothetical protein [Acidipropionibacterium jensenii]MDN6811669.1 hypothetical protein [Acidipropionibacterium jensenii]
MELAAAYLDADARIESISHKFDDRRAALAAEQEAEESAVRRDAGRAAHQMIDGYGVTKSEAAERLGITVRQLNETLALVPAEQPAPTPAPAPAAEGPDLLDAAAQADAADESVSDGDAAQPVV